MLQKIQFILSSINSCIQKSMVLFICFMYIKFPMVLQENGVMQRLSHIILDM